jgi:hypothetical protein
MHADFFRNILELYKKKKKRKKEIEERGSLKCNSL